MSEVSTKMHRIIIERVYKATLNEVWALWTTKEGIESWWGPGGFSVKVKKLDLRPGGDLLYTMTAIGPQQVAFMKKAGMPLSTEAKLTYSEVIKMERLAYTHLADFIPGIKPYDVATLVELRPDKQGVRMILTLDPMHDEEWTQRAVMGMEGQLEKLAAILGTQGQMEN
jgi:uncharacterized protein YndB with AHSA1/START domain